MFLKRNEEIYRVIFQEENGAWLISYDNPNSPFFVSKEEFGNFERIEPPESYQALIANKISTSGWQKRKALIAELLEEPSMLTNRGLRNKKIQEIAKREHTTIRRIQKLYFRHLAGRPLIEERKSSKKEKSKAQKDFSWAVDTFYYSAKKMSLRTAYDCMLLSKYTDQDGKLFETYPTWNSFRHYFYRNNYQLQSKKDIARSGLTNYQRNKRPLFGSTSQWKKSIGSFQIDATQADIYLVSRLDRTEIIGRPNIYMAVDTATQLIAGIYVGLEAGEQAMIECLANAATDKVEFCKHYGIEIPKEAWPNNGLPGEIITDKGREFVGSRMNELAMKYGIEFESLPPFRPDGKGMVEKMFDLMQQRYKPMLRGKGVIESDAQERWAVDYRSQAVLTLEDFTKIIIYCVLYLNGSRSIQNCTVPEVMPLPAQLWRWHEAQGRSIVIPIDSEKLYLFGLPRKRAVLSRKGISNQGLWYISKKYKKLLEQKRFGENIQIAYDPGNISRVYLIDNMQYIPFELASYCSSYAGITEVEHQMVRKKQKVNREKQERLNTEGKIKMLQGISSVVEQADFYEKEQINRSRIQMNKKKEQE